MTGRIGDLTREQNLFGLVKRACTGKPALFSISRFKISFSFTIPTAKKARRTSSQWIEKQERKKKKNKTENKKEERKKERRTREKQETELEDYRVYDLLRSFRKSV